MANIWIVSLFEPTPVDKTRPMRYMGIADAAIRAGHHITHFACTFRHSTKVQRFNENHEVKAGDAYDLVFVHASPYKKNISYSRLQSHAQFTANLKTLVEQRPRPDVILVALPPLSQAKFLVDWGKKNGIPVIVDIIDPWPDAFTRLFPGVVKPFAKLAMKPMYDQLDHILKNCTGLIAISNQYVNWAKGHYPGLRKTGTFLPSVPYREVREKIAAMKELHPREDKRLTLIYAGNLGVAYDIPVIMEAAEVLDREMPGKTSFIIAGSGHYQSLVEECQGRLGNVQYVGRLGYDELLAHYSKADLGIAQYAKGATQSVTYKLFDYLSAGLPVLNSLMSEMAKLIDEHQVGFNNEPGDSAQLVAGIRRYVNEPGLLEEHKQNALIFAQEEGDNDVVYKRIVEFLMSSRSKLMAV